MTRHRVLFAALATLMGAGAFPGCRPETEARHAAADPAAVVVSVEEVTARPFATEVDCAGTVRARDNTVLAARVAGQVREVKAAAGETVRKGQVLALIDVPELLAGERAAGAAALAAEAATREAEQALEAALAQEALGESTLARYRKLGVETAVTRHELDEVESRARAARAARQAAEARIEIARRAAEQAAEASAAASSLASYEAIQAPFAGRIGERRVDAGNFVTPGTPLFLLDGGGPLRAECWLDERFAGQLEPGDPARVESGLGHQSRDATVAEVASRVEAGSRAFRVAVELADTDLQTLATGSFARIHLPIGMSERLTVPEVAVVRRGQLDFVHVVANSRAHLRLVTLGLARGARLEVLSGLAAGERVVVAPVGSLVDGGPVTETP